MSRPFAGHVLTLLVAGALVGWLDVLPATAQQAVAGGDLSRDAAEEIIAFLNDPGTVRFAGRSRLPESASIRGDVGVLGGPFTLLGRIEGHLVVVNGDLRIGEEGVVTGDVTVVGGSLSGLGEESVEGRVRLFDDLLDYRQREGRLVLAAEREEAPGLRIGGARFTVRTSGSYNRIEGLPVLFGPTFRTRGDRPLSIEALALWRTEAGLSLDDDELGYRIRVAQRLVESPRITLGAVAASTVEPISAWGLTDLETSLSAFLLHKDFRDHYDREGWRAYLTFEPTRAPLSLTLAYRDEDHRFAPVSSPWTLQDNDDPWRPQPLVAEGDLRTFELEAVLDTRNDPEKPTDGWLGSARIVRGVSGALRLPETIDPSTGETVASSPVDHTFTAGLVDFRRYARLTPHAELSLRLLYGGSLDGDGVPPQFQQALGGEGSLPGYRLFAHDCAARGRRLEIERSGFDEEEDPRQPVFPRFGCDRAALFQLEYRSEFDFSLGIGPTGEDDWGEEWDWYPRIDLTPAWAVFFDAGRGWSADSGPDTDAFADIGVGLFLGDLGVYWAYPLEGSDKTVNFFVRLSRRF